MPSLGGVLSSKPPLSTVADEGALAAGAGGSLARPPVRDTLAAGAPGFCGGARRPPPCAGGQPLLLPPAHEPGTALSEHHQHM